METYITGNNFLDINTVVPSGACGVCLSI